MSDWTQQMLVPPRAVEVRISLGFVPERDHAQVMVETFDPATRAVLSQWSRHHFPIVNWPSVLEEAVQRANENIAEFVDPF